MRHLPCSAFAVAFLLPGLLRAVPMCVLRRVVRTDPNLKLILSFPSAQVLELDEGHLEYHYGRCRQ